MGQIKGSSKGTKKSNTTSSKGPKMACYRERMGCVQNGSHIDMCLKSQGLATYLGAAYLNGRSLISEDDCQVNLVITFNGT